MTPLVCFGFGFGAGEGQRSRPDFVAGLGPDKTQKRRKKAFAHGRLPRKSPRCETPVVALCVPGPSVCRAYFALQERRAHTRVSNGTSSVPGLKTSHKVGASLPAFVLRPVGWRRSLSGQTPKPQTQCPREKKCTPTYPPQ